MTQLLQTDCFRNIPAANIVYVYCDSGRRSSAAAFLLSERGFTVHALCRGLARVPVEALVSTAPA